VVKHTVSERAFEEYLSKRGIVARYEELPSGITQPADYSFELAGQTLRFDVKEWKPPEQLEPHFSVGSLDPYRPVRKKIEEGRKKFKQYKGRDEPCVLVLYHYGLQLIELNAIVIFGAMRGDLGWVFPINLDTGVGDASRTEIKFTAGGKMIHQTPKASVRVQNTTISAVAVLKSIRVRNRRVSITLRHRQATAGRNFTLEEIFTIFPELYNADKSVEVEPCVVVYDNLDAAVPLPHEFPGGPYDERFGRCNDRLCRTYVGGELAAIESEEEEVGIRPDDPLCLRT
jgi:hypothetical protein